MAVSALVFDFDGLILDTEVPEYVTIRDEFEAHGLELRLEDWLRTIGRGDNPHWLDVIEAELGAPLEDRVAVKERRRARHHELIHLEEVRAGVVALLDEADALGVPTAVASSSTLDWVGGHLERLGIHHRFVAVRTRDDVELAKPWPDLFLAAADAMAVDPAGVVVFEDSHNGCSAAKAAGMYCVVVPNDITRAQDFSHADWVVDSLEEVTIPRLAARLG